MEKLRKCECCQKPKPDCELSQSGEYWLCVACQASIAMRQAQAKAKKYSTAIYQIDRAELLELWADSLLPVRSYIYFALKLEYPGGVPDGGLDIETFCQDWEVSAAQFLGAIASLGRKGIIQIRTKRLDLETLSRKQRIAALEQSVAKGGAR